MKKYLKYLKYVLEHKKNVFIECWKAKEYKHAFTHDLSKFRPSEFIPYARHFYGDYIPSAVLNNVPALPRRCKQVTKEDVKAEFEKAWILHYKRNKHHPEYWNMRNMDLESIAHMVCDLKAMGRKFGDTAQEYYLNNYDKWELSYQTRMDLEYELGLNESQFHNYGHTLKDFAKIYDEDTYNGYFGFIRDEYKIDSYKLLNNK